jgi:ferredoxin--NADP+ reductase
MPTQGKFSAGNSARQSATYARTIPSAQMSSTFNTNSLKATVPGTSSKRAGMAMSASGKNGPLPMKQTTVMSAMAGSSSRYMGIAPTAGKYSMAIGSRTGVRMQASAGAMPMPNDKNSALNALSKQTFDALDQVGAKIVEATDQFTVYSFDEGDNANAAATAEYASDLGSMVKDRPQTTAKIENFTDAGVVANTYKPKTPLTAKVIFNETLTGPDAGEVVHVAFDHEGKLPYAEGQSIGILPPGVDANGKPHKLRLYSIASSAPGDYGDGKTISLCVKRLIYNDEEGKEVRGVCSNYIGDLKAGDEVQITGPVGKALLLPDDPKANIIMLATGTGIAPFRSFLWRFFFEEHPDYNFDGKAWLFLGVPTSSALLYDEEFKKMKDLGGDKFQYDYAISREQTDADGQKMYIQNRMKQYAKELWDLMQKDNTYIYMCGLKGMEKGIQEALEGVAQENGVEWADFVKQLKAAKRYHVEVY